MQTLARRCLSLAALSLAAACDPPAPAASATSAAPVTAPPPAPTAPPSAPAAVAPSAAPGGPVTSADAQALAKSSNAFGLDLYGRLRAAKGNLVISPFSVHTALAMTWAGAKGDTAAQMKKVLHLENERALDAAGSLIKEYGAPDNKVTLHVVDQLFGEKTYAFEQPFLSRVQQALGAPFQPLDFAHAAENARGTINAWVAKETQDRIKDLIPAGGVDGTTRLVLTNAIYFLGDWETPFKKDATSPAPFFSSATDKKDVPTMHETTQLRFAATDGVKVADLPYANGAFALTLVVPDAVDGLGALEARLTPEVMAKWLGAAAPAQVALSLPKLEIAPPSSIELGPPLSAMGMPLAFDAGAADFTGIANPRSASDRLHVSHVFHKGFIKVDEKGTEAAAATGVTMSTRGMVVRPKAEELKADHPFLYFLRDTRSGLVLFMGRVADPAAK